MEKSLIEIPDFNPDSLFYLTEIAGYRDSYEIIEYAEYKHWHRKSGRRHGYEIKYKPKKYGYVPRRYVIGYEPLHNYRYYWSKFIFKTKQSIG